MCLNLFMFMSPAAFSFFMLSLHAPPENVWKIYRCEFGLLVDQTGIMFYFGCKHFVTCPVQKDVVNIFRKYFLENM